MTQESERGAVAVEFAILLPLLLMLVLGIVEFSRAFNVQVTITNAAREGVRTMAINKDKTKALAAAKNAASHLSPALSDSNFKFTEYTPDRCPTGEQMTVTVSYSLSPISGLGSAFALQGKGTMLCGG